MEAFPWWNNGHRKLAADVDNFVENAMPRAEEAYWKREIPKDLYKQIAEKGYFGAGIPKQFGGMDLGATGAAIVLEGVSSLPGLIYIVGGSMMGGLHQVMAYGNDDQKEKILPRIAKGELGVISITEAFAGTDASAIETVAVRDGDEYILSGKKRFNSGVGTGQRYMVYARTSSDPEHVGRHQHLSAFIVEKGMPGFCVEKVAEIIGFDNTPNGYLDFDDVRVPLENRIGEEGQGWRVMTAGLNFERTIISASILGIFRTALKAVVGYSQRRIQFSRPTIEFVNNQFKIADLIINLQMSRLATYYSAFLFDLKKEPTLDSSVAKVFNSDKCVQSSLDAIQVMGGDGLTKFYPLERLLRDAKTNQIVGGTTEALKLVIYREGLKRFKDELRMPRRVIHKELGVPVHVHAPPTKQSGINKQELLNVLAEDYRVNPGLHMSVTDLKDYFDCSDEALYSTLEALELEGLIKVYRNRSKMELIKATYKGLKTANPLEYYRWFPSWMKSEDIF